MRRSTRLREVKFCWRFQRSSKSAPTPNSLPSEFASAHTIQQEQRKKCLNINTKMQTMNKGCNSKSLYTLYVLVKLKKTAFDYDGRTILIARIESCTKKQCCYSIQKHFKQPLK